MDLPDKHNEGYQLPPGYYAQTKEELLRQALPREEGYTVPKGYHAAVRQRIVNRVLEQDRATVRPLRRWLSIAAVLLPLIIITSIVMTRTENDASSAAVLDNDLIIDYMVDIADEIQVDDLLDANLIDDVLLQEMTANNEAVDYYLEEQIDDLDLEDLHNLM